MKDFFIYQYEDSVSSAAKIRVTVLFIHQKKILSQNTLAQELNVFFQRNSITDKLVVILPKYIESESLELFTTFRESTFVRVPGKSEKYFNESLIIYQFDTNGEFFLMEGKAFGKTSKVIPHLLRSGATIIFKKNGGLVESSSDHHFVFPSNKHCAKFIRTGNVLVNQSEIFFLSIQLLKHFKNRNSIYCDTSSINVLPYMVFELKRRFGDMYDCPIVRSFRSYELFEKSKETFPPDALILISSSTSGNIIDRILKEKRADRDQIQLIYFLGPTERYQYHHNNIICNLTQGFDFPLGEIEFDTFDSTEKCKLCVNHSRPIYIRGDVFLTIQPKLELHLLSIKSDYYPRYVVDFIQNYICDSKKEGVVRVYNKDNDSDNSYELYFDMVYLIENIGKFRRFHGALNKLIDKSIPANTKYLLYLPDAGSEKLANYIVSKIPSSIKPELVKFDKNFLEKIKEKNGTIVIVASCITTGKKLLQISRLMRNSDDLSLVYFTGIFRPINENFSLELINALKKGKDKSDERPFIAVEKIYCSIQQVNTSWKLEQEFLSKLLGQLDEVNDQSMYEYVNDRINVLIGNKENRGFRENVFLKKIDGSDLALRKNFAFWNFEYDINMIAQSEVYFTISSIITNLENRNINSIPSLQQTNYVRNILSPTNFHRFNDGIIQAALLRSGKPEYFSYDLSTDLSLQMKEFLLSIIENYSSGDGEALLEFLLAIGMRKLKLQNNDLNEVLSNAINCPNSIISGIATYIDKIK